MANPNCPVLQRPLESKRHRVGEPVGAGLEVTVGFASGESSAPGRGEVAFQLTAGVDVDGLVDDLAALAHPRVMGKVSPEPMADLLRRLPVRQPRRHVVTPQASAASLDSRGRSRRLTGARCVVSGRCTDRECTQTRDLFAVS